MEKSRESCPHPLPDSVDVDDAYTIRQLLQAYGELEDLTHKAMQLGRKVTNFFDKCHMPVHQLRIDGSGPISVYYGDQLSIIHTIYHIWAEENRQEAMKGNTK